MSHGSAHRQVYALCLLAAAPALAISGTTAYSAYVNAVSPHTSTLIAQYARFLSVTLAAVWLVCLPVAAGQRQTGRTLPYPAARWGQTALAITAVLLTRVDPTSNGWGLRNIAVAALFATLTLAVTRRCGISRERLGIRPPGASTARGRAQAISVGATVGLAALISIVIVNALPTFLPDTSTPYGGSQAAFLGWSTYWLQVANVLYTGVVEDVVMVAAVVSLLTLARRPAWEMYALSITIEIGMHLYFGVPALGVLVVAAVSLALYRHTGRLTAIVIGHIAYDLSNDLPLSTWALGALLGATALAAMLVASACTPVRSAVDWANGDSR